MAGDTPLSVIPSILDKARDASNSGKMLDIDYRVSQVKAILQMVIDCEDQFIKALEADLGASKFWASNVELETVRGELKHTIAHMREWAKSDKKTTPPLSLPAASEIQFQPFGVVLSLSPWNYPISLCLLPMATALAAGNVVIAKPSEISVHTSALIAELIPKYVDPDVVQVVLGGVSTSTELLKHRYDFIHYTGGTQVGKIIYQAAAKHLTPVLLELGGKSPVIVTSKANLKRACQRIAWGKWTMNMGQTCISPDYVLIQKGLMQEFVDLMKKTMLDFYGDPKESSDVSRIISERHASRIKSMLDDDSIDILAGGDVDESQKYISPTLVKATSTSKCMQEEIFGPILPILPVSSTEEAISIVREGEKPLALYVFSEDKKECSTVLKLTSSGGACVNDTIMHCGNFELPFGGVGHSGIGAYHGIHGFQTFSHKRAVLTKFGDDVPLRFPPYTESKLAWLSRLRSLPLDKIMRSFKVIGLAALFGVSYKLSLGSVIMNSLK